MKNRKPLAKAKSKTRAKKTAPKKAKALAPKKRKASKFTKTHLVNFKVTRDQHTLLKRLARKDKLAKGVVSSFVRVRALGAAANAPRITT